MISAWGIEHGERVAKAFGLPKAVKGKHAGKYKKFQDRSRAVEEDAGLRPRPAGKYRKPGEPRWGR